MEHHTIAGDQPVEACRTCGGVWAPRSTLDAVVEAARARPLPKDRPPRKRVGRNVGRVVYRRCPVCEAMMARRNFARISGVILDSCPEHGTYFDHGELPDVVEFVRGGGLELAQRKENEELARERARLRDAPSPGGAPLGDYTQAGALGRTRASSGLDLVASFVGWAVWWDR